jgi:hypothetical protein
MTAAFLPSAANPFRITMYSEKRKNWLKAKITRPAISDTTPPTISLVRPLVSLSIWLFPPKVFELVASFTFKLLLFHISSPHKKTNNALRNLRNP